MLNKSGNILIEWMVASVLAILLLNCIFKIYILVQKNFLVFSEYSITESNLKIAAEILTNEIKLSGYIGCGRLTKDFPIQSYQRFTITPVNKLMVKSNEMTVRHAAMENWLLSRPMEISNELKVENSRFKKNNILIISDCKQAEIFRVKKVFNTGKNQIIIPEEGLHHLFEGGAEVSKFEVNHFFIKEQKIYLENVYNSKIKLIDGINELNIYLDSTPSFISLELIANNPIKQSLHTYVPF